MSEITIGLKTMISVGTVVASVVSAYWLARRAASKDTLELERKFNKLRLQIAELASTSQDREGVRALVRESLDNLSVILTTIKQTSDSNSDELREVLIQQGILKEKVHALEEHRRASSSKSG